MDKNKASQIINDRVVNGLSYRTLGKKYRIGSSTVYRIIMSNQEKKVKPKPAPEPVEDNLPDDVKTLKERLRKAELTIELQNLIIDISSKELGVDLRKKRGTRQS